MKLFVLAPCTLLLLACTAVKEFDFLALGDATGFTGKASTASIKVAMPIEYVKEITQAGYTEKMLQCTSVNVLPNGDKFLLHMFKILTIYNPKERTCKE